MALLLVGFGLRDSIVDIAKLQYHELQLYDANIILDAAPVSRSRMWNRSCTGMIR